MEASAIAHIKIKKAGLAQLLEAEDDLAVEEPLEIQLQYGGTDSPTRQVVSVTMRTPGSDGELALGFLFTEGILQHAGQVAETRVFGVENKMLVQLHENETPLLLQAERNFYTTSSCGVCGKASIDAIKTVSIYKNDGLDQVRVRTEVLCQLPGELGKQQTLFKRTGGLHASALFDLDGELLMLREDVGRHNALDKLIGAAFMHRELPLQNKILLLSGRASFELIQKASMAGIQIVAAVGAPSSLAVELAAEAGLTLVGFLRDQGFNIYAGDHRIH